MLPDPEVEEFLAVEQLHDRRIIEKVSRKKPLLEFEQKIMQDEDGDFIEREFFRQIELDDIV